MSLRQLGIMNQNLKAKLEEVTKERDEALEKLFVTNKLLETDCSLSMNAITAMLKVHGR